MSTVTNTSPLHGLYSSTAATEQALQQFACRKLQRHLSPAEIAELSWLHYRHRIHGNAHTTWRDYHARFGSPWSLTEKRCQNRWSALHKLAIQIRMVEPWDFDSRRTTNRAKRYLQFTQAFLNFPWAEVIGHAETEAKDAAQLLPTDPDVAALLRWREGEFPKSENSPAPEPEHSRNPGIGIPEIRESGFSKSGNAPAETPCDNRAESDSLKTYKKPIQETLSSPSHSFEVSCDQIPAGSDLARLLEGEASTAERSPRSHGPTARAHLERSQPSSAPPEQPDQQQKSIQDLIKQAATHTKQAANESDPVVEPVKGYILETDEEGHSLLLNPTVGMVFNDPLSKMTCQITAVESDGLIWFEGEDGFSQTLTTVQDCVDLTQAGLEPLTDINSSGYTVSTPSHVASDEGIKAA